MATTNSAAAQIERAHNRALEVVRELHGSPEGVEYLENLGGHLSSVNFPAQLASAQSVFIGELAGIVQEQAARIRELEKGAKPSATRKKDPKK